MELFCLFSFVFLVIFNIFLVNMAFEEFFVDKKKRLLHLDVMRLIAIYLVLFNHTADKGYKLFMSADSLPVYYLELCFDILVMTAVPVFLTVSGATLLQRNESYSKLFFNRIFRFSAIL